MKSNAATVAQYLASLPEVRRAPISTVRRFIRDNLDESLEERMQYGVIAYTVPRSLWPHGTRTNPELPLMYMGLSSQKNDMVMYMLFLYENQRERAWFDKAWRATGKNLHLQVAGMACCLRFKKSRRPRARRDRPGDAAHAREEIPRRSCRHAGATGQGAGCEAAQEGWGRCSAAGCRARGLASRIEEGRDEEARRHQTPLEGGPRVTGPVRP